MTCPDQPEMLRYSLSMTCPDQPEMLRFTQHDMYRLMYSQIFNNMVDMQVDGDALLF